LAQRLLPAALLLTLTYLLLLLLMAPLFDVRQVVVTGDTMHLNGQITALTGAQGQNIFTLRGASIAQRIAVLPDIKRVEVRPMLPDRLDVRVEEYTAKVVWHSGGRNYLVTDQGYVIKEGTQAGLLQLNDDRPLALAHGDHVDARVIQGVSRLQTLLVARGVPATRYVTMPDDTIAVEGPSGWRALFGLRGDMARGSDVLAQVLQRGLTFQTLDLRPGASPFYR